MLPFKNRSEAGKLLAEELSRMRPSSPLVLALPRGGVPVGAEVAAELQCPLDTLVARKIGSPFSPEFAVGALAPHDVCVLDEEYIDASGASRGSVEAILGREKEELQRRIDAYKSGTYAAGYVPGTVILVDDGVATGLTAKAALLAARARYKRAKFIFASPVCLSGSEQKFSGEADETVCLIRPSELYAIGQAYEEFPQLSDDEVRRVLEAAKKRK